MAASSCVLSKYLLLIIVTSGSVVSGGGALEVALADALVKHKPNVKGRAQLGVQAFADALLVIPKVREFYLSPPNFKWSSYLTLLKMIKLIYRVTIHTVSASDCNYASLFIGFGPELWLWPTGNCAEAADWVQRVWSAGRSWSQHRLELQHTFLSSFLQLEITELF